MAGSIFCVAACGGSDERSGGPASREFAFRYDVTVGGFPPGARSVRIWLPLPESNDTQTIRSLEIEAPVPYRKTEEKLYGNDLAFLELDAPLPETVPIALSFEVERPELSSAEKIIDGTARERLLEGDRLAPLNEEVRARAREALARDGATATTRARALYDRVLADVDYDKSGEGWGRGDVKYVCDAGKGNCSDFHTLFIAMARTQEIPSLFEIGFPLPPDDADGTVGGYHCWAWFRDGDLWKPVDISEADKAPGKTDYFFGTLCPNRVAFSRGRDLVLDPPQEGDPVNFLVYPYVEVDGQPGRASIEKTFTFRDL